MDLKRLLKGSVVPILIVLVVLLLLMNVFQGLSGSLRSKTSELRRADTYAPSAPSMGGYASDAAGYGGNAPSPSPPRYGYQQAMDEFAPDVKDRKIEKTSTLSTEIPRGAFDAADVRLHSIVDGAAGFILNQNVQEFQEAKRGTYSLKVPSAAYDSVVAQLKALGEVISFSENARDVTGAVVNQDVELAAERERLTRLSALYRERSNLDEKLRLENAIFDQERKIKYLEDSLSRLDQNTQYSSLSVAINEKAARLGGIEFLGLRDLAVTFSTSLQWLLYFLAAVLPWAAAIILLALLIDWYRKHRGAKQG